MQFSQDKVSINIAWDGTHYELRVLAITYYCVVADETANAMGCLTAQQHTACTISGQRPTVMCEHNSHHILVLFAHLQLSSLALLSPLYIITHAIYLTSSLPPSFASGSSKVTCHECEGSQCLRTRLRFHGIESIFFQKWLIWIESLV